jgi:Uncharacterised protein family (UPF0149)
MLDLDEGAGITLYVFPDDEGEDDLATWCEGYLDGVVLSEAGWYEHGEPEEVGELLFPFMLLSGGTARRWDAMTPAAAAAGRSTRVATGAAIRTRKARGKRREERGKGRATPTGYRGIPALP